MKRFVVNSLLLLAIIISCDYVTGTAMQRMFFANISGAPGYVLNHIAAKPYDAYVMGASGAQRGYVPQVLEKELGLSVFNTGEAGTNIFYNYASLQLILKHNKPKLIIWDITNADYYYRPDAGKTGMITPYYHDARIRQLLYDIAPLNRFWLLSKTYPYNQKVLSIVGSFLRKPQPGAEGDNGYHGLEGVLNPATAANARGSFTDELANVDKRSPEMAAKDKLIRKYFLAFIELCQKNDIKLVAIYCPPAPLTKEMASQPALSTELKAQLEHHSIPLYAIMPAVYHEMNDLSLYYDTFHLNDHGARVFSTIVSRHLKGELNSTH